MKGFTPNGIEWIGLAERKVQENDYILACYTINPTFPGHGGGVYTNVCFYPKENRWGKWNLGNVVLCKCGKPAGSCAIGKESFVAWCSDCQPLFDFSEN
jgi:hypothetical protein